MRTYKSKNKHTKPSKSGVKNMPSDFEDKHKDSEDDNLMGDLRGLFGVAVKKMSRKTAWTGEEIANEIDGYFTYCEEKGLKPFFKGLSLYIGCNADTLYEWHNNPNKYGVISDLIRYAKTVIEAQYINRSEKYPTANLFLLRTSHGHVETSKVDITSNTTTTPDEVKDVISKLGLDKPKTE